MHHDDGRIGTTLVRVAQLRPGRTDARLLNCTASSSTRVRRGVGILIMAAA